MRKRITTILVGSLAAALIAAGCGGSDDSELTKAEFLKQADAICLKSEQDKQARMEAFLTKSSAGAEKPLKLKELQELSTEAILPPLRVQADKLSELEPPGGEEGKGSKILKEYEAIVTDLEKNPLPLASATSSPFTKVAKDAADYGFKTCILYY